VHFHPNHMGRLMHRLKWSHQKPERRAIECDTMWAPSCLPTSPGSS
jgi:transposase